MQLLSMIIINLIGSSKKRSSYDRSDDPMSGVSSPKKTKVS